MAGTTDPVVAQVEPDPGRPYAAYAAALLTILTFVGVGWLTDDTPKKDPAYTSAEFKHDATAGLLASGITGIGTFAVKKPLRRKGGNHAA